MNSKPTKPVPQKPVPPKGHRDDVAGGTREAGPAKGKSDTYVLRLYIAGQTPKSVAALANLKIICAEHLAGRYQLQVVDLLENPQLARGDQILAIPTLVRKLPLPMRRIIGDLSNTERVLVGLDIRSKV